MIELACVFEEAGRPIRGYLAVDRFVCGSSSGGVRMRPDLTSEELRLLASRMTLKYGFLGIPQGGAKAGIAFDPGAPDESRRRVLFSFGRELFPLVRSRAFIPGPDMGTTPDDIRFLFAGAGRKPSRIKFSEVGSGAYTGLSVFAGAEAALAERGKSIRGAAVAIEGFGKVGASAARLFFQSGAKVVAVSTQEGGLFLDRGLPVPELIEAAKVQGPSFVRDFPAAGKISKDDLLGLDVDVLSPCSLSRTIHAGNAETVRAGIISSGANAPLTAEAEMRLHSRSVLVLPDFMTSSGGVLGIFLEIGGFRSPEIARLVPELIAPRIRELIRVSEARGVPPQMIAAGAALERFARLKEKAEAASSGGRLFRHKTVRSIRRLAPRIVAKRLGLAYFKRNLAGPMFGEAGSRPPET